MNVQYIRNLIKKYDEDKILFSESVLKMWSVLFPIGCFSTFIVLETALSTSADGDDMGGLIVFVLGIPLLIYGVIGLFISVIVIPRMESKKGVLTILAIFIAFGLVPYVSWLFLTLKQILTHLLYI